MGEVYRAKMGTIDGVEKLVALKVTRPNLGDDFAALFVDEARVALLLSHANIVQAFDVGRIDDRMFLAMEYVDGVNLTDLLWACEQRLGQLLPHRYAVYIAIEVLKGLDYAHRRTDVKGELLNLVHRDISPGNILISKEGEVKIADFGIAKSSLRTKKTTQGRVKGKLPYIAPEQLRESGVDRRTDLYATGSVLYEMLTGTWKVDPENPSEAISKVLQSEFQPPRAVNKDIPSDLEAIVLRALQNDPADRYANAPAMRHDLEQFALQHNYLLSSSDLGDFLESILTKDDGGYSREASLTGLRRESSLAAGLSEPQSDPSPFNAALGLELRKLDTGKAYSVYTTGEVFGNVDPEAALPKTSDFAAWNRSHRWVWVAALVIAIGALAAFVGMGRL